MDSLFTSASLIVAFFGGMVMLFAPCCITLMLPAYLGSTFKVKSKVLWMTLLFAAGVASIIIPVVLGARFIVSFFNEYHFFIFAGGSLIMIGVGFMSLFNKSINMPFVSKLKSPQVTNSVSAYTLGVVSGISSTCCAPVLLGALSLAALSPSLLQAAAVGLAYTFGIVFPLFILGFFLENGYWKWGMKLQQKTLSFGNFKVALSNFISFLIFTITGLVFLVLAMANRIQMGEGSIQFGITLRNWIEVLTKPIRVIPYGEYIFGAILFGILIYFIRAAFKHRNDEDVNSRENNL
jgi:cytochrome c biogenesis protein CcdA